MRLLSALAAAIVGATALSPAAHAQDLGALVGSYRFAGCDDFICQDVTFSTWVNTSGFSPYAVTYAGTVTGRPAYFAAGNGFFDGSNFILPFPFDYATDWEDGAPILQPLSAAAPTASFAYGAMRIADPVITGASLRYYALFTDGQIDPEFRSFQLTAVPVTATPEPATLALVGGGLLLVGAAARRRRAAGASSV